MQGIFRETPYKLVSNENKFTNVDMQEISLQFSLQRRFDIGIDG